MCRPIYRLSALVLALVAATASAQRPSMPSSAAFRPQQMPPPTNPSMTANPGYPPQGPSSPAAAPSPPLMSRPIGYNPNANLTALPSAPSLATSPPAGGFFGGYGGFMPNSMGYGYALQGIADYTRASGQYWNDIQQARMSQEKVRQEQLETQRQRIQFEADYEKLRPTAAKMRDSQRIADLDWARNGPPNTEIWSGRTFNVLLQSILTDTNPTRGPAINLEPAIVNGLNLRDKSARGNISYAKDGGQIDWPDALLEKPFDPLRDEFTKKFAEATEAVRYGKVPERTLVRQLRNDLTEMDNKIVAMVGDLSPMEFIDARRTIRTLTDTLQGMSNPITCRAFGQDWRRNVHTVADLVDFCMRNGLEFGPATRPTDFSAYSAAYFPIRNYERGLIGSTSASR